MLWETLAWKWEKIWWKGKLIMLGMHVLHPLAKQDYPFSLESEATIYYSGLRRFFLGRGWVETAEEETDWRLLERGWFEIAREWERKAAVLRAILTAQRRQIS